MATVVSLGLWAGTEGCWNAGEGKGVMGLVLWIAKWLAYR